MTATIHSPAMARVADLVARSHSPEEMVIEQRRVSGAPSVDIRCRCGETWDFASFGEHVAEEAVAAAESEMGEVAS